MSDLEPHINCDFAWSAHPASERVGQAVFAACIVLGAAAAVWFSFNSPGWAAASLIILIVALNRFFFPSHFVIDSEGITASYLIVRRRARWSELRRFLHDEHGGFLSTRDRHSRLDAYRGLHILFGAHRDEVVRRIKSLMARSSAAVDSPAFRGPVADCTAQAHGDAAA